MSPRRAGLARRAGAAVFAASLLASPAARANPMGGRLIAGSARIEQPSPKRLNVVQGTQKAIIDWRSFSIGAGEHADFQQPSASSVTLNRVTGGNVSEIHGRLTANGNLFLVNPNGILFGQSARIDVNGLVATTSDIRNDDFLAGRYSFKTPGAGGGYVINRGTITAAEGGLVALVAPWVENSGVIEARLGRVALGAGLTFTLDLYGDRLIQLAADGKVLEKMTGPDGTPVADLLAHSGRISAEGGTILLTAQAAKGIVDNVINLSGVVEARTAVQRNGEIILAGGDEGIVRVSGALDASGKQAGQRGGRVEVLGNRIGLFGGALIDVSGDGGGGTALIGGDYQGKGAIPTAAVTYVAPGASLTADALTLGDGGKVIVWADGTTWFAGSITARGGPSGGDGGFVEVSGKQDLAFRGWVDTRAPKGRTGTLLLDPDDINIVDGGGGAQDLDLVAQGGIILAATPPTPYTISETALEGLIQATIILQANNNITISNLDDNLLALGATASVVFTADADGNGAGAFTMNIGDTIRTNGASIRIDGATVTVGGLNTNGGGGITLNGRNGVTISNAVAGAAASTVNADTNADGIGTLTVAAPNGSLSTGNNTLTVTAANLSLNGNVSLDSGTAATTIRRSTLGTIGLGAAGGDMTLSGAMLKRIKANGLTLGGTNTTKITVDNVAEANSNNISGTLTLEATAANGQVTFSGMASTFNALAVNANDRVSVNASLTTDTGALTLDGNADNAGVPNNDIQIAAGVTLTSAGALTLDATTGGIVLDGAGAHTLSATGIVTLNDNLTAPGGGSLTISAADLALVGTVNTGAGSVTISRSSAGTITLGDGAVGLILDKIELAKITATGLTIGGTNTTAITVDNISEANSNNVSGTLTLEATAAGGAVTFQTAASTFNALSVNATGAATMNVGVTTDTGNLSISATNIALNSTLNSAGSVTLASSGTIGLGDAAGANMTLSKAQLASITAASGLTIGGANTTGLTVNNLAVADLNTVTGPLTLNATGAGGTVTFSGLASTVNRALNVNALAGVTLNQSLTTAGATAVNADTNNDGAGTLTVAAGMTLSTGGNPLTITVADLDLQGTGSLNSGAAATTISRSSAGTISLGGAAVGLAISGDELQNITATGLTIGGANTTTLTVDGITALSLAGISGTVTLNATAAGGAVTFQTTASTFKTLAVNANDRVSVNASLTTDTGALTLDGDANNSNSGGAEANNDLRIAAGVTLTSAGALTLDATTGGIVGAGALTLNAAGGVTVNDSLTTAGATSSNADTNNDGAGSLTVAAGMTLSTGGNSLTLTLADIDLQGSLNSGGAATTISRSSAGTLSLGGAAVGLAISGAELQKITAAGLTLGGANTTTLTVDGVTAANLAGISGTLTLTATGAGGTVSFSGAASTINKPLNVNALAGVTLSQSLTTGGATAVNADTNNDGTGTLTVAAGMSLSTGGNSLTITAADLGLQGGLSSGGAATTISRSSAGTIGLGAAGDMNISGAELQNITAGGLTLGGANTTGITVDGVTAGQSNNVSGTLTLEATAAGGQVTFSGGASTFNALSVKARDRISLNASLTTDTGGLALDGNSNNAADANDDIRIAAGVTLTSAGALTLDATAGGITGAGGFTLNALSVTVNDNINAGGVISTRAGGGITFNQGLTLGSGLTLDTTNGGETVAGGNITLNGALNAASAGGQDLTLRAGTSGDVTFNAAAGGTARLGALTIESAGDVTVGNVLRVNSLTQDAGSGTTDFGTASLDAAGAVTVKATDIKGNMTAGNTKLLASGTITGDLNVNSLTISGASAVLTGKVAGAGGAGAAALITIEGPKAGPYTMNGHPIGAPAPAPTPAPNTPAPAPAPAVTTPETPNPLPGTYEKANTVAASIGTTQTPAGGSPNPVSLGESNESPPDSPADAVFRRNETSSGHIVGPFDRDYALIRPAPGTENLYRNVNYLFEEFWRNLGPIECTYGGALVCTRK